ncbi:MAG: cytochrome c biogenesis heme-transporting ATPase CcmA [Gammaproteobacteria bacterium]|nr:cytochrome c biogenesis heme-transporting ATPase CcmA [Gammaproteobacteria bacterium]
MLEARELGCRRDGRSLFENLSFKVEVGQLWLVRGANGSGKTSLLRILAGLSPAEQGELIWQGEREPVLWVGHRVAVSAGLTARENLEFMAALEGDEIGASAAALEAVGLGAFSETRAGRLSEGQARRVALARLAFSTRRLWLLDEPLTSLDETSVNWFETQVHRQLDRGGAVVMATHREISDSLQGWTLQLGA